jgi:cell division protein FtsB
VHFNGVVRAIQSVLPPVFLGGVILYFSYHALAGDQGLARWTELQSQEGELKAQLAQLKAERSALDAELDRLRDETLDLDYVEELARTKLSYARGDELLVAIRQTQ